MALSPTGGQDMRHEQIADRASYTKVDMAAVWPVSAQIAPAPVLDLEEEGKAPGFVPTPAAPDVPAVVGKLIIASYAGLLIAFTLATVASAQSIFAVIIAAMFMVAFFTVPALFLREEPKNGARPSFDRFMRDGMGTLTGHSSGGAALVQMLIVPVFLTMGALAMGVAAAIIM